MENIEKLNEWIKIGEGLKDTFIGTGSAYKNIDAMISSNDITSLSTWLCEIVMFIEEDTILKDSSEITQKFILAYRNVETLKKNVFLGLLGDLISIKNNYDKIKQEVSIKNIIPSGKIIKE